MPAETSGPATMPEQAVALANARHLELVDPALRPLLDFFPPIDFQTTPLAEVRAGLARMVAANVIPADDGVLTTTHSIPGPSGAPPVRVLGYRPVGVSGALPAVLHLHPGGYVVGSADMTAPADREMVRALRCAVFAVDYRLAPETRHPGPVEDCYAALQWLHAEAEALGVDRRRIGVLGESAGGGLAACLALLARDRGQLTLAFQHLIAPTLDDRSSVEAAGSAFVGQFVWTREQSVFGWSALLGVPPGSDGVSPYAAAARASDLAGLPPAFIAVGALDRLAAEGLAYAARLGHAGVTVELHMYPGAFHGFDASPTAWMALAAAEARRAAMRRAFDG